MKQIFLILSIFLNGLLVAQVDIQKIIKYTDSITNSGVNNLKAPGVVVGIASSDSIFLLKGYGYSNYDKKIVVDPEKTLFQIGSVGKLFTSIGLLQQIEKKKISLTDNVNTYLEDWKIRNSFDQPVTPFHLLTHSAGFNDHFVNYMAKKNSEIESLERHLPKNMPSVFKAPGTEINYSNYSYALAGHLIERVSGNSFEDHIQSAIFNPLKMLSATYYVPDNYEKIDSFANGYKTRELFEEVKMFPRHAKPAGSIAATGREMITFAQALLKRDTTLLKSESYDLLLNQQFSNHSKLKGYTLGMEVQNFNGHIAYTKAGQTNGFLSILILFPDLDLSLFMSTNTQTDNHFNEFFLGLRSKFFSPKKADLVSVNVDVDEFTGVFANERANHENIEELFQLLSAQFTLYKSKSGNLGAYYDNEYHKFQYIGEEVFQNLSNSNDYIVFKRNNGKLTSMYRNVNVGGIQIPASYKKLNWFEQPRFLNGKYPYLLVIMVTYLLIPLLWVVRFYKRKKNPDYLRKQTIPYYYHAVAFLFLGLFFWNVIGFIAPLIKLGEQMVFGVPDSLVNMKYFNWAMAVNSIALVILSISLWMRKKSTIMFRIYYTVFSLITLSHILILHRWHFLNVTL